MNLKKSSNVCFECQKGVYGYEKTNYCFDRANCCRKTEISIELAKVAGGEIISADSMQVYKQMDIGTAKIKKSRCRMLRTI